MENKNFTYIRQKNQGVAVTKNKGMDIAKGQYLAFLDSDDIWDKQKIEKQIKAMKSNRKFFSYTGIEMINEDGKVIKPFKHFKENVNYQYLLRNTIIATSSVLLDIEEIGKMHMLNLNSCEDYIMWFSILKRGYEAIGINAPLVKYRKTKGSLSANKSKNIKHVWNAQVKYMGEKPINASDNCLIYAMNGIKKHIF